MPDWSKINRKYLPFFLFLVASSSALNSTTAWALTASVAIPLKTSGTQAVDLMYQGQAIDRDEATDLHEQGVDLSLLNPVPSDIWTEQKISLSNAEKFQFPSEGSAVHYRSLMESAKGMFRARVETEGDLRAFRLVIYLDTHAALARAALMRAIGYTVDTPQHYRTLKVKFDSILARDQFVDSVGLYTREVKSMWVQDLPKDLPEVTLRDVTLESPRLETPPYYLSPIGKENIQGRRATRALIVPLSFLDFQESINLYSWEAGRIQSRNVVLNHPYSSTFNDTTFEDARWVLRRIAELTRADFKKIVAAAKYPDDISAIILEKVISRRNNLVELFKLKSALPKSRRELPFNSHVNIGAIKDGKLTQAQYDGHAETFSYGELKSPLRLSELKHFFKMELISVAIGEIARRINNALTAQSIEDVHARHLKDKDYQLKLQKAFIKQALKDPTRPFVAPLSTYGGFFGGVSVNASRNLSTGLFYGSESKAQLVDNIAAQASLGYFFGAEMPTIIPGVSANLSVQRNYIHVRPIENLEAVKKEKWKNLFVPGFMNGLSRLLDPPVNEQGEAMELTDEVVKKALGDLLKELREGEVLTVTDSVIGSASAQVTLPLTVLINPLNFGLQVAAGLGLQGDAAIIRRTMITRTGGQIQVYVQAMNTQGFGQNLDLSAIFNVLKFQHARKKGQVDTRAFLVNTSVMDDSDELKDEKNAAERRKLYVSLVGLLGDNSVETMAENYSPFNLDHDLKSKKFGIRATLWKKVNYEEDHNVLITPPEDPEKRYVPEDEARTLFSSRRVHLKGRGNFGFLGEVVTGISKLPGLIRNTWDKIFWDIGSRVPGLLGSSNGDNPSASFLGRSSWTSVSTEAEITPGKESPAVTFIEQYWAGWYLSHKNLLKILKQIDDHMKDINDGVSLYQKEEFQNTRRLEAYEIRSTLIIYDEGSKRLKEHLLKASSRRELFIRLVDLNDTDDLRRRCRKYLDRHDIELELSALENRKEDNKVWNRCIEPWMRKAMRMTRKYPKKYEDQLKWTNRLMDTLQSHASLTRVLKRVGTDNFYFQVKVTGFRTHDERAADRYGESKFITNTIGKIHPEQSAGIFNEISSSTRISNYELQAKYFGDGL